MLLLIWLTLLKKQKNHDKRSPLQKLINQSNQFKSWFNQKNYFFKNKSEKIFFKKSISHTLKWKNLNNFLIFAAQNARTDPKMKISLYISIKIRLTIQELIYSVKNARQGMVEFSILWSWLFTVRKRK